MTSRVHSLRGNAGPGAGEGHLPPEVPPTPGSASCPGPQVLGSLAGVWSLLRHLFQRGSFHFVVASSTFVSRLWDPDVNCKNARVTPAPSRAQRLANQLAERTAEACSIVRSWQRGISCSAAASLPSSPSLFHMEPYVELARARARRTDFRPPSVGTIRSTLCQAFHWRVDLSSLEMQLDDLSGAQSAPFQGQRPEAVNSRYEDTTRFGRVHRPSLVTPASSTPALQPLSPNICARTSLKGTKGCGTWLDRVAGQRHVQAVVLLGHGNAHACSWHGTGLTKGPQGTAESCTPWRHAAT